jgi:hypothetical protein
MTDGAHAPLGPVQVAGSLLGPAAQPARWAQLVRSARALRRMLPAEQRPGRRRRLPVQERGRAQAGNSGCRLSAQNVPHSIGLERPIDKTCVSARRTSARTLVRPAPGRLGCRPPWLISTPQLPSTSAWLTPRRQGIVQEACYRLVRALRCNRRIYALVPSSSACICSIGAIDSKPA